MRGVRTSDDVWNIVEKGAKSNNLVAQSIYDFQGVVCDEVDYIELLVKNEEAFFSFLPTDKKPKVPPTSYYNNAYRQDGRIGKVIQKFLKRDDIPASHLKKFVEMAQTYALANRYELSVVEGNDIAKWYHEENYLNPGMGELGNSCMRYNKCKKYFKLYTKNPNVSMVIVRKHEKLCGRALVWRDLKLFKKSKEFTKSENITMLDRIYFDIPKVKILIEDWGKANCDIMLVRARDPLHFYDTQNLGKEIVLSLSQTVPEIEYEPYPYCDTMAFLEMPGNTLYNFATPTTGEMHTTNGTIGRAF